ncbi:MAG TPA: hydrogenase maturation protease [Terriglobia bacterium]|nr:hydrogenase maturation protease [Terriglobia bacterium]
MDEPPGVNILVIGVGNPYRRDDGAGLAAARKLRDLAGDSSAVAEHGGEGAALLDLWKGAAVLILLDAVQSGAKPGTIHRLDASSQPLPAALFRTSTHAFSIAQAVELARALGELPQRVIVYGIEGKEFESGTGLSGEVEEGVVGLVERVRNEIRALRISEHPKG